MIIQNASPKENWTGSETPITASGLYEFLVSTVDPARTFYTMADISVGQYANGGQSLPILIYADDSLCFGMVSVNSAGEVSFMSLLPDGSAAWAAADSILWRRCK